MRSTHLVFVPLALAMIASPVEAQISATIHIGPQRNYPPAVVYREPPRVIVVDYQSRNFGKWKKSARYWHPVTLYVLGGQYYQQPYRDARPIVVYNYNNSYFQAPRDRDWDQYRVRYERDYWGTDRRDDRRDDRSYDRYDRRDDRRDDRYDTRYDRGDDQRDDRHSRVVIRDDRSSRNTRVEVPSARQNSNARTARPSTNAQATRAAPSRQGSQNARARRRN